MKRFAICFCCFLAILSFGFFWSYQNHQSVVKEQHSLISEIVNIQVASIERRLSRSLSTTEILAIELRQNSGHIDQFETFAQSVIDSIGGVSNLQLAPGGVIEQIHPLAGNERAIGHNILKDDRRKKEAWEAVEHKALTLAGPFELVQGGIAVIGRNPVFISQGDSEQFWGFASALIFLDDLLSVTDLKGLEEKGYSYQLLRRHPDTDKIEEIARSVSPVTGLSHRASINVPNGIWQLRMSHSEGGGGGLLGYVASFIIAILATWILWIFLKRPEELEQEVQSKTIELAEMAFHDHLTGLENRRSLAQRIAQVLAEARRYNKIAALLYLDLDDFKRVNDSMGHDAGDKLLKQIASRLQAAVRESDFVARLGGDEFAVLLLNEDSVQNLSQIAEKLIHTIEQPVCLEDRCFRVSTSVGVTMIPYDGEDVATLLGNADLAMYSAKNAGKGSYHFFNQKMQDEVVERHQLEADLSEAIAANQLELYYQPIINLETDCVASYEALVRWHHPKHGFMPPIQFIGLAEESGKIIELGYWVLRDVCERIYQRTLENRKAEPIAVNLSPKQFADPNLLDNIRRIVREVDIDVRKLEVEITESTLMENVDAAVAVMEQLRTMGVKIAIDDFGTGYSSLALLKRFPVDKLKIDRGFIAKLETDRSDQKIVRAIIAMAHTLHIEVVAEGIETSTQLSLLKSAKCDLGQGFLFARPEPAAKAFSQAVDESWYI